MTKNSVFLKLMLAVASLAGFLALFRFMGQPQILFPRAVIPAGQITALSDDISRQQVNDAANRLSPTGAPWQRIAVMPVFFVPSDEQEPTQQQVDLYRKHLELAQARYRAMLKSRDTFSLSSECMIYKSRNPLDFFRSKKDRLGDFLLAEVLDYIKLDRHTCGYVFAIVLMNPHDNVPAGGGIPINAGYNTGGGILEIASWRLDTGESFQSTLEHELGHAFGLPHVDEAYGHNTETSLSIMSYNPRHRWKGLTEPAEPATLMPEDLKALSFNKRVFPNFTFKPQSDIPEAYPMVNKVISLWPPAEIPGRPPYRVTVLTDTPGDEGSLENVCPKFIESPQSRKTENMWVSKEAPETAWISIVLQFPQTETLTAIILHSQHGDSLNRADALRIEYDDSKGFTKAAEQEILKPDVLVRFEPASARQWKLSLKPGSSRKITIRGVEFFNNDIQLYPPLYPYKLWFGIP